MMFGLQSTPSPGSASPPDGLGGPWLLLAEMNHRVANGYALAAASIKLAARHAGPEARVELNAACERLHAYADAHRALLAPQGARADVGEYLTNLCLCMVRSTLEERGVMLNLVTEPVEMSSGACWRVGLIVSELIVNALRHGATGPGGVITVELTASAGEVECAVRDNGTRGGQAFKGQGSQIVMELAKELGGRITGSFCSAGACVVLSIGAEAACNS